MDKARELIQRMVSTVIYFSLFAVLKLFLCMGEIITVFIKIFNSWHTVCSLEILPKKEKKERKLSDKEKKKADARRK